MFLTRRRILGARLRAAADKAKAAIEADAGAPLEAVGKEGSMLELAAKVNEAKRVSELGKAAADAAIAADAASKTAAAAAK